jgi:YceI-like domain
VARFSIVPERSQVWIDARSNVHPIHSATTGLEGYVDVDVVPDGTIDLSTPPYGKLSLSVDKLKGGNRMEDREMQKRIDAQRYPRIEGELDQVTRNGADGSYRASGNVTFRGVKRRHEDLLSIDALDDRTIRLTGSSRFDIREFGMQPPKVFMLKVEPEVDVRVDIVAVRDEPD